MRLPTSGWKLIAVAVVTAVVCIAAVVAWHRLAVRTEEVKVSRLARDEIVVIRTKGGRLQASTLVRNEEFGWQTSWDCPLVDCGRFLPRTLSEVRLPVHYTFAIPLANEWRLKFRGEYFELVVPREEVNIPPGLEVSKLEMRTTKGWLSPDVAENQLSLMKHLGPELASRAARPEYLAAQRDDARKTVAEFARKWMVEQGAGKDKADYPIKVFFEGEVNWLPGSAQAPLEPDPTRMGIARATLSRHPVRRRACATKRQP
jgi:hypothetical protein